MSETNTVPIPPEGATHEPYTYPHNTAPMDGSAQTTTPLDGTQGQTGTGTASWQGAQGAAGTAPQGSPYVAGSQADPFSPSQQTYQATQPQPSVESTASQQKGKKAKAKKESSGRLGNVVSAVIGAVVAAALCMGLWTFTPLGNRGVSGGNSVNATTGEVTINTSGDATAAQAVAAKCLNSVVTIYVYSNSTSDWSNLFGGSSSNSSSPSALGSGVIIKEDNGTYYVVTNYHVVEGISRAVVKVGDKQYDAQSVGYDEKTDLAVISIQGEGLTVAEWGDSSALTIGEWVGAIGSPYGYEQSVTAGIVSALYRTDTIAAESGSGSTVYTDMIQTDAAINPGNSGGGLFNAQGQLVGINTYITSQSGSSASLGFAIPQSYAQEIAEELINGETVQHAFLGVSMGQAAEDGGVEIAAVYKDTAADKAGLHTGDIITKVGDREITQAGDVSEAVRSHKVGDTVTIEYKRDGETATTEATLGGDADEATEYAENGAPKSSGNNDDSSQGGRNGNGGNGNGYGNGGNGFGWGGFDDYFGFDLDDLFGGNPFSYDFGGNSGSGNSGSGNSGNNFWNNK